MTFTQKCLKIFRYFKSSLLSFLLKTARNVWCMFMQVFLILIYFFLLDNRKEVASPQGSSNFKSRMKETFNLGKQEVLLKDMNSKLQRMLEETLIKNIQMQQVWV